MTHLMKSILSRVLSQEIAHQEQWEEDDIKNFGHSKIDRQTIIKDIKAYMQENDIRFSQDDYFNA